MNMVTKTKCMNKLRNNKRNKRNIMTAPPWPTTTIFLGQPVYEQHHQTGLWQTVTIQPRSYDITQTETHTAEIANSYTNVQCMTIIPITSRTNQSKSMRMQVLKNQICTKQAETTWLPRCTEIHEQNRSVFVFMNNGSYSLPIYFTYS